MQNLARRVRRDYAATITLSLAAITLCIGFIAYAFQMRALDASMHDALDVYVARAQQMQPITTEQQVAQLVAGTSHPGWALSVAEGSTRFVVRWPSGIIGTEPRNAMLLIDANPLVGFARIGGLRDAKAIVKGTELRIIPGPAVFGIAYQTLLWAVIAVAFELLAAMYLSKRLAQKALRPLNALHGALTQMAQDGTWYRTLPEPERDDLADLIRAYNLAIEAAKKAREERDAAEARTHQFIADASHQLRTPLTVLSGFVSILRRGQLRSPDDGPKILEKMEQQIAIIRKLVERMMLLQGWSVEHPACEVVDVAEFVRTVVEPIAISRPERTVRITGSSSARACVDQSELIYALTNVVANALKYAPESAITVDVSADDTNVYVSIADKGPGIPPEELPHVFDRFYRGSRRDVPGSGLGLAIARAAVERSGGTITVASELNKGACFTITLPREPALTGVSMR